MRYKLIALVFFTLLTLPLLLPAASFAKSGPAVRPVTPKRTPAPQPAKAQSAVPVAQAAPANPERIIANRSIVKKTDDYLVVANYPNTGNNVLDAELEIWVTAQINRFTNGVENMGSPEPHSLYELNIDYELHEPSSACLSILFRISTNIGGNTPGQSTSHGMVTFTYSLLDGRKLRYEDMFIEHAALVPFLAAYCQETLLSKLDSSQKERIIRGTAPAAINFNFFVLTPGGMDIYFPPYQVADSQWGEQKVHIPLQALQPFGPQLALWDIAPGRRAFPLGGSLDMRGVHAAGNLRY